MTTPTTTDDVVDLLVGQHMQIRDLFTEVAHATGTARKEAFDRLVRLLAVHETAEEEIVHPMARRQLDGGQDLIDDRLSEEKQAKEALAHLESLGPDHPEFDAALDALRQAVLAHARSEERYEFGYLRQHAGPQLATALRQAVAAAEKLAPTHPHPGVETGVENMLTGPVVAVFDRIRDAMRDAT
jgi:hemerythrin superfamily protein